MNQERRLIIKVLGATLFSDLVHLNRVNLVFGQQPEEDFLVYKRAKQEQEEKEKLAPFYFNGNPNKPYVSITVDDCWNIENAKKIIKIAEESQVKLTFFPGAYLFINYPSFWHDVLLEGHEIENHTVNHFPLTKLNETEILDQIDRTQQYYQRVIGKYRLDGEIPPMRFIRPPYGTGFVAVKEDQERIRKVVAKRNLGIVLWNHNLTTIQTISPGAIVLLHANDQDLIGLQNVIKIVKDRGLIPVTVNELLNPKRRRQNQIKFEKTGEF